MEPITPESPEAQSADLVADNIAQLKALFPELVTEAADGTSVNIDVLKQLVGDQTIGDVDEKYGLNWHGKRAARKLALTPSLGTLRPCPDESKDWETTQNLFIEGDNLEVLKLLQKSYAGKVKLIYIDPPYNTGKDFVYPDNFKDNIRNYKELTGQVDGEGRAISSNSDASGRFHTDWLNMMYPRLKLAHRLLKQDGLILVSINHYEIKNLMHTMAEVFGDENYIAYLIWKSGRTAAAHFTTEHEYIVAVAKNEDYLPLFKYSGDASVSDRAIKKPGTKNPASEISFPAGIDFECEDKTFPKKFGDKEPVEITEGVLEAKDGKLANAVTIKAGWAMKQMIEAWLNGEEVTDQKGQKLSRFFFKGNGVLQYEKEKGTVHPKSIIEGITTKQGTKELEILDLAGAFDYPKPTALMSAFIDLAAQEDGDIVMDFFAGSGSTAHATYQVSAMREAQRKYILVQLPEPVKPELEEQKVAAEYCDKIGKPRNIAELTKERLRRAAAKIQEENPDYKGDLGFRVFKLDSSNIKAWNAEAIAAAQSDDEQAALLDEQVDHLLADRTEDDILYELLLKLGLDLCVPIEQREIAGKTVYSVGAGVLMVCLAESISYEDSETLAQGIVDWNQELAPATEVSCVFRDSGFADDKAKANTTAILDQAGLKKVRSI